MADNQPEEQPYSQQRAIVQEPNAAGTSDTSAINGDNDAIKRDTINTATKIPSDRTLVSITDTDNANGKASGINDISTSKSAENGSLGTIMAEDGFSRFGRHKMFYATTQSFELPVVSLIAPRHVLKISQPEFLTAHRSTCDSNNVTGTKQCACKEIDSVVNSECLQADDHSTGHCSPAFQKSEISDIVCDILSEIIDDVVNTRCADDDDFVENNANMRKIAMVDQQTCYHLPQTSPAQAEDQVCDNNSTNLTYANVPDTVIAQTDYDKTPLSDADIYLRSSQIIQDALTKAYVRVIIEQSMQILKQSDKTCQNDTLPSLSISDVGSAGTSTDTNAGHWAEGYPKISVTDTAVNAESIESDSARVDIASLTHDELACQSKESVMGVVPSRDTVSYAISASELIECPDICANSIVSDIVEDLLSDLFERDNANVSDVNIPVSDIDRHSMNASISTNAQTHLTCPSDPFPGDSHSYSNGFKCCCKSNTSSQHCMPMRDKTENLHLCETCHGNVCSPSLSSLVTNYEFHSSAKNAISGHATDSQELLHTGSSSLDKIQEESITSDYDTLHSSHLTGSLTVEMRTKSVGTQTINVYHIKHFNHSCKFHSKNDIRFLPDDSVGSDCEVDKTNSTENNYFENIADDKVTKCVPREIASTTMVAGHKTDLLNTSAESDASTTTSMPNNPKRFSHFRSMTSSYGKIQYLRMFCLSQTDTISLEYFDTRLNIKGISREGVDEYITMVWGRLNCLCECSLKLKRRRKRLPMFNETLEYLREYYAKHSILITCPESGSHDAEDTSRVYIVGPSTCFQSVHECFQKVYQISTLETEKQIFAFIGRLFMHGKTRLMQHMRRKRKAGFFAKLHIEEHLLGYLTTFKSYKIKQAENLWDVQLTFTVDNGDQYIILIEGDLQKEVKHAYAFLDTVIHKLSETVVHTSIYKSDLDTALEINEIQECFKVIIKWRSDDDKKYDIIGEEENVQLFFLTLFNDNLSLPVRHSVSDPKAGLLCTQ